MERVCIGLSMARSFESVKAEGDGLTARRCTGTQLDKCLIAVAFV